MDVDDPLRTKYLAAEAGNAVFAELDHRNKPVLVHAGHFRIGMNLRHVNDVRGADEVANPAARAACNGDGFNHVQFMALLIATDYRGRVYSRNLIFLTGDPLDIGDSNHHRYRKLVRNSGARTTDTAISAVPALLRVGDLGSVNRHLQDVARTILDTVPAQLAMAAMEATFRFRQCLSFAEPLIGFLERACG